MFFKFDSGNTDNNDEDALAATYLRGNVAQWIKLYLTNYLNDYNEDEDVQMMFET
jgi:hypothetical protein